MRTFRRIAAIGVLLAAWVALRIGALRRFAAIVRPISIERLPGIAARRHADRVLVSTDTPCGWGQHIGLNDPKAWTAREIDQAVGRLAHGLVHDVALGERDRVAVLKSNHFDVHILAMAVIRAGAVACPMNAQMAPDKVEAYLLNIGASILITDRTTAEQLSDARVSLPLVKCIALCDGAPGEPSLNSAWPHARVCAIADLISEESLPTVRRGKRDTLYLVHSSGTTGFPKAVALKNGAQTRAIRAWLCYVHVGGSDRGFVAVPHNHQAVLLTFNACLLAGLRLHSTERYGREGWKADQMLSDIALGGYTAVFAFPIVYTQLVGANLESHDLSRVRYWASTADAAHEAIIRRLVAHGSLFRRVGIPVRGSAYLDAQGSSEVGTPSVLRYYFRFTRRYGRRIGMTWSAPLGPKVRVTSDGRVQKRGHAGRLEVRGPTLFGGYWNNHELTEAAFNDGWFFTGDVAKISKWGQVTQLDREVDVIRAVDGPVYSLEIEEVLHKHPAVFDCCVFGARQSDGFQRPRALVALRALATVEASELLTQVNERLPARERLEKIEIVPWSAFPVGVTGKTLKRELREATEPETVAEANRPIVDRAVSVASHVEDARDVDGLAGQSVRATHV